MELSAHNVVIDSFLDTQSRANSLKWFTIVYAFLLDYGHRVSLVEISIRVATLFVLCTRNAVKTYPTTPGSVVRRRRETASRHEALRTVEMLRSICLNIPHHSLPNAGLHFCLTRSI